MVLLVRSSSKITSLKSSPNFQLYKELDGSLKSLIIDYLAAGAVLGALDPCKRLVVFEEMDLHQELTW